MLSWLIPSVLSAGGQLLSNRANLKESARNREFQERMSSTAAQRSKADYAAAGFNPALAYDKGASTPGGSQAHVENVLEKGVSSGLAAKQLQANIELTNAQKAKVETETEMQRHDLDLRQRTVGDEPSWRDSQIAERVARLRELNQQGKLQPHDLRIRQLEREMMEIGLSKGQYEEETRRDIDRVRDFIRTGVSSAGEASKAFRAWMGAAGSVTREGYSKFRSEMDRFQPRR